MRILSSLRAFKPWRKKDNSIKTATGFTLIEIALVMVILSFLLGGLLLPMTAQIEMHHMREIQKDLNEIKNTLIGYALSHAATDGKPYLPCPDTDGDGSENRSGTICVSQEGDLPWSTLGVANQDSWNRVYRYRVAAAFSNANNGFVLTTNGDMVIRQAVAGAILANNIPVVIYSLGKGGAGAGNDEVENSDGDTEFVSHGNTVTVGNEFDDMLTWIPAGVLVHDMVAAGRLP